VDKRGEVYGKGEGGGGEKVGWGRWGGERGKWGGETRRDGWGGGVVGGEKVKGVGWLVT